MNFRKIKTNLGKAWITNLCSFFALAVSLVSLVIVLVINSDSKKVQYQLTALQIQPRLTLCRPPHIKSVFTKTDPFSMNSLANRQSTFDSLKQPLPINATLRITSQLFLKNTGNALAKGFAYVQIDTPSWQPIARQNLLEQIKSNSSIPIEEIEKLTELLPGDSTIVTFENDIAFVNLDHFTLHYLVLYENELGNLYDTYVWAPFKAKPVEFGILYHKADTGYAVRVVYPRIKAGDVVSPNGEPNITFWTYAEDDAKDINRLFQKSLEHRKKSLAPANQRLKLTE